MWENWKDFILLLLICLSCVINSLLDRLIIPLKLIDNGEKASVRMLSMFYVIIILVYLNMIGDESEYSPVMMYYLGLMIGRFVYFDASFADFIDAVRNLFGNLLLLVLGLILTSALAFYGFNAGYLLERNYFIVGVFYTQLFMLAAVFILHHSHVIYLFVKKDGRAEKEPEPYEEDYEEEGDYDYDPSDYDYDPEDEFLDYEEYDNEEENLQSQFSAGDRGI